MSTKSPENWAFIRFFTKPMAMGGLNVALGLICALALFSSLSFLGDLLASPPVPIAMFTGAVVLLCWVMHKRDKKQPINPVDMNYTVVIGTFLYAGFWITSTPSLLSAVYGQPFVVAALPIMVAHLIVTQVRFGWGPTRQPQE
ncbi:hypothetical protein [Pseudomonas viridiflava]|uniref:hypothetical protein n=1 Tax=Pseudomonas viridiflava TaxID=33069 RepID=UPI000F0435A1|nr:hypothetical protein [Pseudomonas viridiflava]